MKKGRIWLAMAVLLVCAGCEAPANKADAQPLTPSPALAAESAEPAPTPAPAPTLSPEQVERLGPFAPLLLGDTSGILDPEERERMDWIFQNSTSESFNIIFEIRPQWSYTLLDLDGDGADELFLRPTDAWYADFIFRAEPDGLRLLHEKSVSMYYWYDPLKDGRLLETHKESETLYRLNADGRLERTGEAWTSDMKNLLVTDWTTVLIPDPMEVTAGDYLPLLRGDFSALDDERREQIERVFSAGLDWEYAMVDLDGDGGKELCLRVVDAPGISAIFHREGGAFVCWHFDLDASDTFEPLSDGTVLSAYYRYRAWNYALYQYDYEDRVSVGRFGEMDRWSCRRDKDAWSSVAATAWYHGDEAVTEEAYTTLFAAPTQEKRIAYWQKLN